MWLRERCRHDFGCNDGAYGGVHNLNHGSDESRQILWFVDHNGSGGENLFAQRIFFLFFNF